MVCVCRSGIMEIQEETEAISNNPKKRQRVYERISNVGNHRSSRSAHIVACPFFFFSFLHVLHFHFLFLKVASLHVLFGSHIPRSLIGRSRKAWFSPDMVVVRSPDYDSLVFFQIF